ncbi:MAG TPA: diacylglycerol kinase family protein, partial [candidate division Zixibacteria bacterium]|nr:diacylglycerol kinase family protein [candidate division Zixibacteria bacterium]
AAGGDGTVNALAAVALEADLPMGILPMGQANNIARSLCSHGDFRAAVDAIINRKYRPIDVVRSGERVVVGSLALGLVPSLQRQLAGKGAPRFAFRWSAIAARAAAAVEPLRFTLKLDAFRFPIEAKMFSINLLAYGLGLPLSPASLSDDGEMEIIFDARCSDRDLGRYIRDVYKGKYVYGSAVRLYRGAYLNFNPGKAQPALLDGDLVELPAQEYNFRISPTRLNLFC